MPIYTRTGDKGLTSLFDSTRVSKSSERVETYGTIDELNSLIGSVIAHMENSDDFVKKELEKIQNDLLEIGASLANPKSLSIKELKNRPTDFEEQIDKMTDKLPELKNFILPGGGKAGSLLHVARTTARKAERRIVGLLQSENIDQDIVIYVNRLSDLLFTMARYVNHLENKKEIKWSKK